MTLPTILPVKKMAPEMREAVQELALNPTFDKGQILSSPREVFFTSMAMLANSEQLQKMMEGMV